MGASDKVLPVLTETYREKVLERLFTKHQIGTRTVAINTDNKQVLSPSPLLELLMHNQVLFNLTYNPHMSLKQHLLKRVF